MAKKLLLGTGNPSKIKFYKRFLLGTSYTLTTIRELNLSEPQETGETIGENARLKAGYYFAKSGLPTLADDAGFEIPALADFPGVRSHRFGGDNMTDEEVINGILQRMEPLRPNQRQARMKVVLALVLEPGTVHTATGTIEGIVPKEPNEKRIAQFPYRSLLYLPKLDKWFYDMTDEEEVELGYRAKAIQELIPFLV